MRPARVLALVTDAFGSLGGIAQYNRDLLNALSTSAAVDCVEVLPRACTRPTGALPRRVRQLRAQPGRAGYSVAALLRALARRPDIVFCGHLYMAPLAAVVARQAGAKLVVQTYGIEVWKHPTAAQKAALEAADLVLAISRDTRAHVLRWAELPPERVKVVPTTVSDAYVPGDRARARAKLGCGDARILLTIGRLDAREQYKGHDRVIPLIRPLRERGHDVVYLVAGSGDDMPRLQRLAAAEGVSDQVRFLGEAPETDVADLYRAADVYLMPSTGEGFGIVFLEAMACGTPAIGLAAGGAVDALCDGELGMAVTAEALLEAVDLCLRSPRPEPEALSAKVRERFGQAVFARRVDELMQDVVWPSAVGAAAVDGA